MNEKAWMRLMIFTFISILPCSGSAQELDSPACYTAEDNFYYLESPRETYRCRFLHLRQRGFGRSVSYHDPSFSGMSSYQGTTTGPGPNGGYPGTPRGSYNVYEDYSTRPHNFRPRH